MNHSEIRAYSKYTCSYDKQVSRNSVTAKASQNPNGGFPKLGVPFGGPNNKDYGILGSILGSPHFGKLSNERAMNQGFWVGLRDGL